MVQIIPHIFTPNYSQVNLLDKIPIIRSQKVTLKHKHFHILFYLYIKNRIYPIKRNLFYIEWESFANMTLCIRIESTWKEDWTNSVTYVARTE